MAKHFINFAILACSLLLAATLFELSLRAYFLGEIFAPIYSGTSSLREPNKELGWGLLPNATAWHQTLDSSVLIRINSKGHRSLEVPTERTSGKSRAVLLGDSFVEAYSVPFEKSIAGLLPSKVRSQHLEVVNLGVGGYSSFQQYLSLKEVGIHYDPDAIVHFIYPSNDLYENVPALNVLVYETDPIKVRGRPFLLLNGDTATIQNPDNEFSRTWVEQQRTLQRVRNQQSPLWTQTILWKLLKRTAGNLQTEKIDRFDPNIILGWGHLAGYSALDAKPETGLDENSYNMHWEQAWQVLKWSITESKNLADKIGAKFLLVNIPAKFQVEHEIVSQLKAQFPNTNLDLEKINRELAAFAQLRGIYYIDLLNSLKDASAISPVYYGWEDRHLNVRGQEIAADIVGKSLRIFLENGNSDKLKWPKD